jgi:hypothetical protein
MVTYNLEVAFMMSPESALLTEEAVLEMDRKLRLTGAGVIALRTGYGEGASLGVVIEFVLAGEDALAAYALEVISLEMLVHRTLVGAIKVAAWLQAMLVLWACVSNIQSFHVKMPY